MESVYLNGGFIGTTLDFNTTDRYVIEEASPLEYVGGRTVGFAGDNENTVISLTGITGMQPGDLVVVAFATAGTAQFSAIGNGVYTTVARLYANDTEDTNLWVAYKFMPDPVDTSITLVNGTDNVSDAGTVAIHVWRNVDTSTPMDVTATTATRTNSGIPLPPAITPTTSGAVILAAYAVAHNGGTDTYTNSNGLDNFFTVGANDTNDSTIGLGSYNWTSGSYTPPTPTWSNSNSTAYSSAAVTLALRPTSAVLGNQKNSGIWNLSAVYDSLSTPVLWDEFTELGTANQTITTIPTTISTANNGLGDWTYAVDITNFQSSDTGVLFEIGGATVGSGFSISGGNLIVNTTGGTNTSASMTAFDGQTGTLYVTVDYGTALYAYWWNGSTMNLILTIGSFSSDYAGTNISGIGAVGSEIQGTNYGTYAGTITEWREWNNTYYDFGAI